MYDNASVIAAVLRDMVKNIPCIYSEYRSSTVFSLPLLLSLFEVKIFPILYSNLFNAHSSSEAGKHKLNVEHGQMLVVLSCQVTCYLV